MTKKPTPPTFVYQRMRVIGVLLWLTGALRMHADGEGFNTVFRVWHPVTWLVAIGMVVPCALLGEKLSDVVRVRLDPFWKHNADQLRWVRPWTRLDAIPEFNHSTPAIKQWRKQIAERLERDYP